MSEKERDALVVLERVKRREITMAEGSRLMGVSYRQCWRRYRRYEEEGAAGLTHRLRGGDGNRSMVRAVKDRIVEMYRGIYEGFGPVLFAEKLEAEHEIRIDHAGGTAVVDKRRAVDSDEEAEKAAQSVAGTAHSFWRHGANGWVASPLVWNGRPAVLSDGDDRRRDGDPDVAFLGRRDDRGGDEAA